jgi:hypothetical protein
VNVIVNLNFMVQPRSHLKGWYGAPFSPYRTQSASRVNAIPHAAMSGFSLSLSLSLSSNKLLT